jgi:NADPH2:quinone reductase
MNEANTMRAIRVHAPGGTEALSEERIPVPTPGEGEALVRVEYAGVNFIDIYRRTGQYTIPIPATLGGEGAGVVVSTGSGVSEAQSGERVAWAENFGAYAEYAVVTANRLVPVPEGVETRTAAAVMLQGMTAHYLACSVFPLESGDHCVVHAAAGGVGLLLIQIAKKRGAVVIGTVSTDEKAELASGAGADHIVIYTRDDFVEAARRVTGSRGVQVVFDSVGRTTFLRGLDALAPRGMMVLFGQSSGPVEDINPQLLNQKGSLFLTRPTLGHYTPTRDELLWRAGELFDWIAKGELDVRIGAEYALADVAAAHTALEGRATTGKVLLKVG